MLVDDYKHRGKRKALVDVIKLKGIKDRNVLDAVMKIPRHYFFDPAFLEHAYQDKAFPIGEGQTISQPYTVAFQTELLEIKPGDKVLDVGSGSGWSTALLSFLVGSEGRVYGVEKIPELKFFGESNCLSYGCANVQFFLAEQHLGLTAHAPYDRILVSAAASKQIPKKLLDQLAPNGIMVIPVEHTIYELKKNDAGDIAYCQEHVGYVFVPLVDW